MRTELEQVSAVLVGFGAEEGQAKVMAKQLLKRSEQVAQEKGISKIKALADLLELVKAGRSGESYASPDKQEH